MKVVAIAEKRQFSREKMQKLYNIEQKNVFEDYRTALECREKLADVVLIAL